MGIFALIWLVVIIYLGLSEKRKGSKEAIEYEKKQNEFLGLEPRSVRLEKMCPTKKNDQTTQ